jgi:tetratricopeptide (TPR) repeat protein
MTPEELERKLSGLQWKEAPRALDEKVIGAARARARRKRAIRILLVPAAAAAAVLFSLVAYWSAGGSQPSDFDRDPALWGIVTDSRGDAPPVGTRLGGSSSIRTGADGLVAVSLRDGSSIRLNTSSSLRVDGSMWRWKLDAGELWGQANPKGARPDIVIDTPAATARVTGTEFNLRASTARTLLAVRHGSVEISNSVGRAVVTDRRQAQARPDAAPRVIPLANEDRVFGWARQLKGIRRHPIERSFLDDEPAGEGSAGTLEAGGTRLSIRRHSIRVRIEDDIATTEVEQVFFNPTSRRLEGTFRFPLPKDASIQRFAMTVTGDKLMEGRIVEKHRARQIYESIVRRMEDPGLLEWQEGNQFSARVFPIEPMSEKRIVIGYTQTLSRRDGEAQYVFPLVSEALETNPPENSTIEVSIKARGTLAAFESPSHHLDISRKDESELMARAEASGYVPLNDLVIHYRVDDRRTAAALTQGDYFLLRLNPEFKGSRQAAGSTYVYWLDASHSTSASLREIQYNLLSRLLARLAETDRFTLFSSNLRGRFLMAEPLPATPENIELALARAWGMDTEGATDLGASMEDLAKGMPEGATVVYIGDGVATVGTRGAAELARLLPAKAARFFAFALGNSVNELLLEGLAGRSGRVLRLTPGDHLGRRVREFAWSLSKPMLRDIAIEIEGAEEVYPKQFTALGRGEELIVLGRRTAASLKVRVKGSDGFESTAQVDMSGAPENSSLARLWAQRRIKDLLATDEGGRHKSEIVSLSEKYSVMSPYTSLLVLETEQEYVKYRIEKPKNEEEKVKGKAYVPGFKDGLRDYKEREKTPEDPGRFNFDGWSRMDEDGEKFPPAEVFRGQDPAAPPIAGPGLMRGERGPSEAGSWGGERDSTILEMGQPSRLVEIIERTRDGRQQYMALEALQSLIAGGQIAERSLQTEALQTLLRYRPRYQDGWIRLGRLYAETGDKDLALRAISTVVEVAPDDPAARQILCRELSARGEFAMVRGELEEITRLRPEEPEAYFQLAEAAAKGGHWSECEAVYRRLLRYNFDERFGPVEERARNGLADAYRAMIAQGAGPRSEIEEKLRRLTAGRLEFKDVRIVLTWKSASTDVDLWVSAPGEEKCSYQQKSTFRGGRLDKDVTTGYGPETYTLPETRSGKWLVEVNYYSGRVMTEGKVEIVLFEGTDREVRRSFPFAFKSDDAGKTVRIWEGDLKELAQPK